MDTKLATQTGSAVVYINADYLHKTAMEICGANPIIDMAHLLDEDISSEHLIARAAIYGNFRDLNLQPITKQTRALEIREEHTPTFDGQLASPTVMAVHAMSDFLDLKIETVVFVTPGPTMSDLLVTARNRFEKDVHVWSFLPPTDHALDSIVTYHLISHEVILIPNLPDILSNLLTLTARDNGITMYQNVIDFIKLLHIAPDAMVPAIILRLCGLGFMHQELRNNRRVMIVNREKINNILNRRAA